MNKIVHKAVLSETEIEILKSNAFMWGWVVGCGMTTIITLLSLWCFR
jgi:hypothetical protein